MLLGGYVASRRSLHHTPYPCISSFQSLSLPHISPLYCKSQVALDDPRVASGMPVYLYRLTVTGLRHNTIYKVGQTTIFLQCDKAEID